MCERKGDGGGKTRAKRPRDTPSDNLGLVYPNGPPMGTRSQGDVQLEDPMHVHRAPKPPCPGSGKHRRTIFVCWGGNRLGNASLPAVFHDTYKGMWNNADMLEAQRKKPRATC